VLPKDTTIIPTGGVEPNNIAEYHTAGADGFGAGSSLFKPGKSLKEIANGARAYVEAVRALNG
jgi:2-dehydro-3-deoxyphosphogalactonate aldolase